MSDNVLAQKIGPLPAGAWLAVAAGGVAAALLLRGRTSAGAAAPEVAGDGFGSLDNTVPTAGNLSVGYPDSNPYATAPTPGTGYPTPTTNEEWAQAATRALLGKGYLPLIVDVALRKYLNGDALTVTDQAVVNAALIAAGPPPIAPPPPNPGTPPPGGGPVLPVPKPQPVPQRPMPGPKPAPKPKPTAPKPAPKPKPTAPKPKPAPKPAPAHVTIHGIKRIGSVGAEVKLIQKLVGTPADGIFLTRTDTAVRRWQGAHHIKVDGTFGPESAKAAGWGWAAR